MDSDWLPWRVAMNDNFLLFANPSNVEGCAFGFLNQQGDLKKSLAKKKSPHNDVATWITWVPPNPTLENSFKKRWANFRIKLLGKQPLDGGMKNCGGPLHPPLHPLPHLSCSSCWHNFSNSLWQRRFWSKNASLWWKNLSRNKVFHKCSTPGMVSEHSICDHKIEDLQSPNMFLPYIQSQ